MSKVENEPREILRFAQDDGQIYESSHPEQSEGSLRVLGGDCSSGSHGYGK